MDLRNKQLGTAGEQRAETFLRGRGYRVVARNWRHAAGEIDLVAMHRGVLVFVEVKTRAGTTYGPPEEALTRAKQRKLALLAEAYLQQHPHQGDWRIDVVAIDQRGIRLIENAVNGY
ncbi:MAG: YraN family protein [Chloroflexota bacterium]